MDREEVLNRTAEKINELAESVRDELEVEKPEDVYELIVIVAARQFKTMLSPRELAYPLNAVAAHILQSALDEDSLMRKMYPPMPDGYKPHDN